MVRSVVGLSPESDKTLAIMSTQQLSLHAAWGGGGMRTAEGRSWKGSLSTGENGRGELTTVHCMMLSKVKTWKESSSYFTRKGKKNRTSFFSF